MAKPCIVTHRRTPIPMAASLSPPTHTPVRPTLRPAVTPKRPATSISIASSARR